MSSTSAALPAATLAAITAAVMRYVNAGISFTALDISRTVQNGDNSHDPIKAPHHSLKSAVHDLYFGGEMGTDYTRTLRDVDAGNQAYVYHLNTVDPDTYDPTKILPLPASALGGITGTTVSPTAATQILGALGNPLAPTPAPAVVPAATVPTATKPLTSRNAMADGRLRIPVKAVKEAGLSRGDKAYLSLDGDEAEIFATAPSNRKTRSVTVDAYDNILFVVGKGNAGAKYDIYASAGYIKAVPA